MFSIVKTCWEKIKRIIRFIIQDVAQIHMAEEKWIGLFQFVKFGIVGISNTVISYIIFLLVLLSFQYFGAFAKTDYLIGQFCGFVVSVLWSFTLNRRFVFSDGEEKSPWFRALLKTYASYALTGLIISPGISALCVEFLRIPKVIAPIISLLITVPLNFILNKYWAFKTPEKEKK